MILKTKETTVAYRCPSCGHGVMSMVGAFSLSGSLFRLKCDCGGSAAEIRVMGNGDLHITLPCVFCPNPHNFNVSPTLFYGRDTFLLPCPVTGADIGFIGSEEAVRRELDRTERELLAMMKENGLDSLDAFGGGEDEELFSDPQIYDIVMFVIKDLEEEGAISCSCKPGEGSYAVDILEDHVRVYCEKCGDYTDIPTDSTIAANAFLHAERLVLSEHGYSE